MVVFKPVAGVHIYVFAPFAIKVPVPPGHTVALVVVIVALGEMLTVDVAEAVQLIEVPVTVYTVLADGLAVTTLPVVALKPVEGVQL